jgi:hypothetical protein
MGNMNAFVCHELQSTGFFFALNNPVNSFLKRNARRNVYYTSKCGNMTVLVEFATLRKATISFVMSVHPHGTTRFPFGRVFMKFDI